MQNFQLCRKKLSVLCSVLFCTLSIKLSLQSNVLTIIKNNRMAEESGQELSVTIESTEAAGQPISQHPEKEWNFIVYMAANNNLHKYALKNFRQMLQVGSNEHCNILVQLDEYGEEEANRFYIQKNKAVIKAVLEGKEAISGTPESLFNFVEWAIKRYPAKRQALVLWNHGSGIKDPSIWGKFYKEHRDDLFTKDEQTGLLQLNRRSLRSMIHKLINNTQSNTYSNKNNLSNKSDHQNKNHPNNTLNNSRGIGFNDVHEQYLDNQQLRSCLVRIQQELLAGKKLDIAILDACHMSMIELASKFKLFADYLVASEEIEPGSGYNYKKLLTFFTEKEDRSPAQLAQYAVAAYDEEYRELLADYTQSAINLENFSSCETAISAFASYAQQLMQEEHKYCKFIKKIRRNDELTTEFCDWDYIDAIHFFQSVKLKSGAKAEKKEKKLHKSLESQKLKELAILAERVEEKIRTHILANASGINLPNAHGLSIYFPEKNIHKSYPKTTFAKESSWLDFLKAYFKKKK